MPVALALKQYSVVLPFLKLVWQSLLKKLEEGVGVLLVINKYGIRDAANDTQTFFFLFDKSFKK